jgi:hypothetical protein
MMESFLEGHVGTEFETKDAIAYGERKGIERRQSIDEWLKKESIRGRIVSIGRGKWKGVSANVSDEDE